jgi:hypothetical protein
MDLSSLEEKLAAFARHSPSAPPPPSAPVSSLPTSSSSPIAKTSSKKKQSPPSSSSGSSITKKNKKRTPTSTKSSKPALSTSSSRFDLLYQQGKKKLARQEKARQSKPVGCTFNPTTNIDKKREKHSSTNKNSSKSRFDRLYENALKTKAKLDAERKQQKTKPSGCTFNPKTNADKFNVDGTTRDARFNRLYEDAQKTRAKIAAERARRADAAGTFKPQITRKAHRSASPSPSARFDKLYKDGQRDLDSQRAKQRADRELKECKLNIFTYNNSRNIFFLASNGRLTFSLYSLIIIANHVYCRYI